MILGVPYDAEVEYLESTGTQWIDTGFAPTSQSKVECNAIWLLSASGSGSNQNPTLFGARNTSPATYFEVLQDANKSLYYQYGSRSPSVSFVYGTRIVYTADANKLYVDGELKITSTAATFSIAHPLALFALNKGGVVERFSKASVYGFKAWDDDGVLARDFQPVRFTNELGQREGAMYDRVSKRLFRNAGTGSFVIGPDVATPVMGLHFTRPYVASHTAMDYVPDGLIAMWDGIENAGFGVHDPSATTWKDLAGTVDLAKNGNPIIGADYMSSYANGSPVGYFVKTSIPSWVAANQPITMEVVFALKDDDSTRTFVACGGGCLNVLCDQSKIYLVTTYSGKAIPWQRDLKRHSVSLSATSAHYTSCSLLSAYLDGVNVRLQTSILYTYGANYGVFACRGSMSTAYTGCDVCALRIYNRVLTADEIEINHAIDKERFNLP